MGGLVEVFCAICCGECEVVVEVGDLVWERGATHKCRDLAGVLLGLLLAHGGKEVLVILGPSKK